MGMEEASGALHESLEGKDTPTLETGSAEGAQQELIDLDKVDKWRYQGKDWTREDWNKSYVPLSQFTKKSQELAESKKSYEKSAQYSSNLVADLENVRNDRQLYAEFLKIYPKEYHSLLDKYLGMTPNQQQSMQQQAQGLDPKLEQRLNRIEAGFSQYETTTKEAQVEAASASIDSLFKKMQEKYPLASEEVVISRAQALLDQGAKLSDNKGNADESAWDKVWKNVNDAFQKQYESHYKKQVNNQKQANVRGKDVASGGGLPGQAPKKMTIKEATEHAIATLTGR